MVYAAMLKKSMKDAVRDARDYELETFNKCLGSDDAMNVIAGFCRR